MDHRPGDHSGPRDGDRASTPESSERPELVVDPELGGMVEDLRACGRRIAAEQARELELVAELGRRCAAEAMRVLATGARVPASPTKRTWPGPPRSGELPQPDPLEPTAQHLTHLNHADLPESHR